MKMKITWGENLMRPLLQSVYSLRKKIWSFQYASSTPPKWRTTDLDQNDNTPTSCKWLLHKLCWVYLKDPTKKCTLSPRQVWCRGGFRFCGAYRLYNWGDLYKKKYKIIHIKLPGIASILEGADVLRGPRARFCQLCCKSSSGPRPLLHKLTEEPPWVWGRDTFPGGLHSSAV